MGIACFYLLLLVGLMHSFLGVAAVFTKLQEPAASWPNATLAAVAFGLAYLIARSGQ